MPKFMKAPSQAQENRAGERIVGSGHGARERRQEVDLVLKISKVERPESIKVGPMPAETRPEPKASFGKADQRASKLSNAGERCQCEKFNRKAGVTECKVAVGGEIGAR